MKIKKDENLTVEMLLKFVSQMGELKVELPDEKVKMSVNKQILGRDHEGEDK